MKRPCILILDHNADPPMHEDASIDPFARTIMHTFRQLNIELHANDGQLVLRPQAFFLLHFLFHQRNIGLERVRQADIATELNLAAPTITQLLNTLEDEDYIQRQRFTDDRRVVWVQLTPAGEKVMHQNMKQRFARLGQVIELMGQGEAEELLRLVQKVISHLQQLRSEEVKEQDDDKTS